MKRTEMVHIIRNSFKKINKAFRSLTFHFEMEDLLNPEDLHSFRVEAKKLRAFLGLAGMAGSKNIKLPKKLHSFYRIIGKVRNIQLQQQRIQKTLTARVEDPSAYAIPNIYLKLLSTEASGNRILAGSMAKDKTGFQKEERRIIARLPAHPGKTFVEKFVDLQAKKIRDLVAPPLPTDKSLYTDESFHIDESLHAVRKILKDLLYTWAYTEQYVAKKFPTSPPLTHKDIQALTVSLGDIQDSRIAIELLQPAYTNRVSHERERTHLLDVRVEWQEEKERKERELYILLRKTFDNNHLIT